MSLIKISQLPTMSQADVDPNTDIVPIVDVSTGETKHVLLSYIQTSGSGGGGGVGTLQQVMDSGSTWTGTTNWTISSSGKTLIQGDGGVRIYSDVSGIETEGSLTPQTDNIDNLGANSFRYKTLYVSEVTGSSFTGSFVGDGSGLTNISTSDDLQAVLNNGSTASLSSDLLIDGGATQEVRITGSYLDFYTDSTMRLETGDGGTLTLDDGVNVITNVGLSVTGPTNLNETTISGSVTIAGAVQITGSLSYGNTSTAYVLKSFSGVSTVTTGFATLASISIPTNKMTNIEASISSKELTLASASFYKLNATFINNSGTVTQVSGSSYIVEHDGFGDNRRPNFSISGTDVLVRIQGRAGLSISHVGEITKRDLI